jgi:hypothetical protein
MINKRNIIIGATGVLAFLALFGYNKMNELKQAFQELKIKPIGLKNLKVQLTRTTFNLSIEISNPTNVDINLNAFGVANFKRIMFYMNGKYLAMSSPNIISISIPNASRLVIQDLPVEISNSVLLQNLSTTSLNMDALMNALQVKAVVEVNGKEYLIEN